MGATRKMMRTSSVILALAAFATTAGCGSSDSTTTDAGPSGSDAGSAGDAGAMSATDAGIPLADGGREIVSNFPADCPRVVVTIADRANSGHFSASRITPPHTPFTVTGVRYVLAQTDMCDTSIPHVVHLFKSTSSTPPATPTSPVVIEVPPLTTPTPMDDVRLVDLPLPTPITLAAGEELFVAVQMIRNDRGVCVLECQSGGVPDRNWWSAAATTPYAWRTLASYGNDGTLEIAVLGN